MVSSHQVIRLSPICSIQRQRRLRIRESSPSLTVPRTCTTITWSSTACIQGLHSGTHTSMRERSLRNLASGLFRASVIFLTFYWASRFRSVLRDYQDGVYSTATALRQIPSCDKVVAIGEGPFPEHGVGWEAGIYASYFAQCRV